MAFVHEDPEFGDLLRIVADRRRLSAGLVEKDYWVTHTLWALQRTGLELWLKGGTSLSKGFALIERFSEDLDLKVEAGTVERLPRVSSWRSEGRTASEERRRFFDALPQAIPVPGAEVSLDDVRDRSHRSAALRVTYPGRHLTGLPPAMRPFVLLEVGSARVSPFVATDMTSFVHEELVAQAQIQSYEDNRPNGVRCVHPLVTLLEKLDALHKKVPREDVEAAALVRHFEDAARVIHAEAGLDRLADYEDVRALAEEMLAQRQVVALPDAGDAAYALAPGRRTDEIRAAYGAIAPMFWGTRIPLDEACERIRSWIGATFS